MITGIIIMLSFYCTDQYRCHTTFYSSFFYNNYNTNGNFYWLRYCVHALYALVAHVPIYPAAAVWSRPSYRLQSGMEGNSFYGPGVSLMSPSHSSAERPGTYACDQLNGIVSSTFKLTCHGIIPVFDDSIFVHSVWNGSIRSVTTRTVIIPCSWIFTTIVCWQQPPEHCCGPETWSGCVVS